MYEYQQQNAILAQQVKDLTGRFTGMTLASSSTFESDIKLKKNNIKSARLKTSSTVSKSVDFKNIK